MTNLYVQHLQRARTLVESDNCRFMCVALERTVEHQKTLEELAGFLNGIFGAGTMSSFVVTCVEAHKRTEDELGFPRINYYAADYIRRLRLAFFDKLIGEYHDLPFGRSKEQAQPGNVPG